VHVLCCHSKILPGIELLPSSLMMEIQHIFKTLVFSPVMMWLIEKILLHLYAIQASHLMHKIIPLLGCAE
jgi:hypothetical protein